MAKGKETPTGRKEQQAFIREGNRAPVAKATHARYRGGTPLARALPRWASLSAFSVLVIHIKA